MVTIAYIVTGIVLLLLAVASWRHARPVVRAGLALVAAGSLSLALSGTAVTIVLLTFDVLLIVVTWQLARSQRMNSPVGVAWIAVLVLSLVIAKLPPLAPFIGPGIWIGVSYLIFRLIHFCLDARRNRLGDESLPETVIYVLNPVTLVAGPIDRVQHNVAEQRKELANPAPQISDGVWRLFIGLFKKAVLANLFYVFVAAHDMTQQPDQPMGIAWLWLIAYAFYLYFDFASYSDVAIGLALLMGIRLPENFANPYAQPTIARFWQAWHITLSNWLRDYIFFPLSRNLLKRYGQRYATPILFVSHLTTMIVCGLWHGIGTGFVAWGIWHGIGLFAHSQVPALRRRFSIPILPTVLSVVLTFAFVTLGWVFFSTDLATALHIFARLFGLS